MTYEEAIKTIEIAIAEVEWDYPMEYYEAFQMAINALEKQIPKKPKLGCLGEMLCPKCGYSISYCADFRYSEDWCPHCGQAIDWSDIE